MTKPTLFICQSCCFSEDRPEGQPADGTVDIFAINAVLDDLFKYLVNTP